MNKFDATDWRETDNLVFAFQNGDTDAAEKLIKAFDGFIEKYVRLLTGGIINFNDRDSRQFISMYIKDKTVRKKLSKRWQSADTRRAAYESLASLQRSCLLNTKEDIRQELICLFLMMAKRYRKKTDKSTFAGYIYSTYRFEVQRAFKEYTNDPLTFSGNTHLPYYDSENLTENVDLLTDPFSDIDTILSPEDEQFGPSWIHGTTAEGPFRDLSILDRLIMKMYHIDQLSDREIAEKTGFHINTVNSRRRAAQSYIGRVLGYDK